MRISFIHDWDIDQEQEVTWQDGLAGAMRELSKRHEITMFAKGEPTIIRHPYFNINVVDDILPAVANAEPDVILHWADMTRPAAKELLALGKPMAVCFAGGEPLSYNTELFDHIFVESKVYEDVFKAKDLPVSVAFGTNTGLFTPVKQEKYFDTIMPGTFAAWKRHDLYAHATIGLKALAVGYMYADHETECWQVCLDNGTMVLPHASANLLHYLYAASKVCVIPSRSDGGSQRTVLEAMAMDIPVVVCDSDKYDWAEGYIYRTDPTVKDLGTTIRMALDSEVNTREYIVNNWSEYTYADALEKGLLSIAK